MKLPPRKIIYEGQRYVLAEEIGYLTSEVEYMFKSNGFTVRREDESTENAIKDFNLPKNAKLNIIEGTKRVDGIGFTISIKEVEIKGKTNLELRLYVDHNEKDVVLELLNSSNIDANTFDRYLDNLIMKINNISLLNLIKNYISSKK